MEDWSQDPEPNPEDLYIEEQMKRDIAEFYRRKYPRLREDALKDLFDSPPF